MIGALWLEGITTSMLLVTTLFCYAHAQYGAALVAGVCAGLVGGMAITRALFHWLQGWW